MTILMGTAHRDIQNVPGVAEQLFRILHKYPNASGLSGGAAGGDTLLAKCYDKVSMPYDLYIPNRYYWSYYDVPERDWMYEHAEHVQYIVERPVCDNWRYRWSNEKWWRDNFARNEAMVKAADVYIAISNHSPDDVLQYREIRGGTAACIRDIIRIGGTETGDGKREVDIHWICPIDLSKSTTVHYVR